MSYDDDSLASVDSSHADDDLSKQPLFRVRQDILINWMTNAGEGGLEHEIDNINAELIGHKPAFLFEAIGTILYDDDQGQNFPNILCKDLIDELKSTLGVKVWPAEKQLSNVVDVTSLIRISSEGNHHLYEVTSDSLEDEEANEKPLCDVPVLLSKKVSGESSTVKLSIDALVTASLDTTTYRLLYMLRDAVFRQQNALSLLLKVGHNRHLYQPMHFQPPGATFPITVMLPSVDFKCLDIAEEDCVAYRRSLHCRFLLQDDRPLFRKVLSCFSKRSSDVYQLVNPHVGLNTPDIEVGLFALISGKYSYHHYMQDNFDDNIWGCAYRSLQTLSSWFWHQGYTDRSYPSHLEIQEALVAIGDKQKTFIGSKEWIGSVEVSYCLDYFHGVTSKTLHVSTGADMAYKGRDLYRHFIEEGTPIMIGGGVLAHTIVGVIFNELTGAVRFLIVDPHFTGHDQLKTVQSKGWVGWKGPEFWNQTAHYNLCMPQRPKMI